MSTSGTNTFHQCLKCPFSSPWDFALENHRDRHRRNTYGIFNCAIKLEIHFCDHCDYEASRQKLYLTHIRRHFFSYGFEDPEQPRSSFEGKNEVAQTTGGYRCPKCHLETTSRLFLIMHWEARCRRASSLLQYDQSLNEPHELFAWGKEFKKQAVSVDSTKTSSYSHGQFKNKMPNNGGLSGEVQIKCKTSDLKKERRYKCDLCEYKARRSFNLKVHVNNRHTNASDILWHNCNDCDYKAKTKGNLNVHIKTVHTRERNAKWYKCNLCKYRSKVKYCLIMHINRKHTDDKNVKWYSCNHCDYKTKTRFSLKEHVTRIHVEAKHVKWFKCNHCEYKSKVNRDLNVHVIRKHTDEKDVKWYSCNNCEYKTKTNFYLKSHVSRRHTGAKNIKWFDCQECGFKAKTNHHLTYHINRKHSDHGVRVSKKGRLPITRKTVH